MIRNFLVTAWRNLIRNKFYSVLNICGLAIGLAVGVMILLWVEDEYGYDRFWSRASDIYKINSHLGKGADEQVWEGAPAPLMVFCRQSIPDVSSAVRIDNLNIEFMLRNGDKKWLEPKHSMILADSTFFSVFNIRMLEGNALHPFQNMNSIVFTKSEARRLFGNEDALGKVLSTQYGNFTITGITEDFPENSTIKPRAIISLAFEADYFAKSGGNGEWKTMDEDLGSFSFQIYLLLNREASPKNVAEKLTRIYQRKAGPSAGNWFSLQPLTSRHLVSMDGNASALQTVRIFMLVAFLILAIACINYVNLSTARSILRSKEVGVRKIIGAGKGQLFIQFITESILVFFIASLLAYFIIYVSLPLYNHISGKTMVLDLRDTRLWLVVGGAVLGSLALASIYPALQLSSFSPVDSLKGVMRFGIRNVQFRKVLVVTQFIFSAGLIIGSLVIGSQLRYIQHKNVGYEKDHVFSIELKGDISEHAEAARNSLSTQPGILGVASASNSIVGEYNSTGDTYWEGKPKDRTFLVHAYFVDQRFIPLMKMQLVDGSNFSGEGTDSSHYILNETAVKQTGIKNPIGKSFSLWNRKGTIIGVVKDFNYASLKKAVDPIILCYGSASPILYVKTTGKDAPAAIASAQKIWKEFGSEYPFHYSFLDDDFDTLYRTDQQTAALLDLFASVAIIVSCIGLLGLATYAAQVKTREIGIRKVLGASVPGIAHWLAKEFLLLVLLAFVIASPLAWMVMNKWLQNYAYRTKIGWWVFFMTGLAMIVMTLITVGIQALRAGMANPVRSLRTE